MEENLKLDANAVGEGIRFVVAVLAFYYVKPHLPADLNVVLEFLISAVTAFIAWYLAKILMSILTGRATIRFVWKVGNQPVSGLVSTLDFTTQSRHVVTISAHYEGGNLASWIVRIVSRSHPVLVDLRFLPTHILYFGRERFPPGTDLIDATVTFTLEGGLEAGELKIAQISLTQGVLPPGGANLRCHARFTGGQDRSWVWNCLLKADPGLEHFEIRS